VKKTKFVRTMKEEDDWVKLLKEKKIMRTIEFIGWNTKTTLHFIWYKVM